MGLWTWNFIRQKRAESVLADCNGQLQNISAALEAYYRDHNEYPEKETFRRDLMESRGNKPAYIFLEPVCERNRTEYGYDVDKEMQNFTIYCKGGHFPDMKNVKRGYPQYSSYRGIIQ